LFSFTEPRGGLAQLTVHAGKERLSIVRNDGQRHKALHAGKQMAQRIALTEEVSCR
jgi:hypothetical protein